MVRGGCLVLFASIAVAGTMQTASGGTTAEPSRGYGALSTACEGLTGRGIACVTPGTLPLVGHAVGWGWQSPGPEAEMGALVQRGAVIRFDPLPDGGSADLPGSSEQRRPFGPYADVLLEPHCEPHCAGPETMGAPAQTRAVLRAAGLPLLMGGIAVLCALGIRPRA